MGSIMYDIALKTYLHLQRLRDNAVVVASASDMKQYLPWPPWVL
jgi:hypothetical protein